MAAPALAWPVESLLRPAPGVPAADQAAAAIASGAGTIP